MSRLPLHSVLAIGALLALLLAPAAHADPPGTLTLPGSPITETVVAGTPSPLGTPYTLTIANPALPSNTAYTITGTFGLSYTDASAQAQTFTFALPAVAVPASSTAIDNITTDLRLPAPLSVSQVDGMTATLQPDNSVLAHFVIGTLDGGQSKTFQFTILRRGGS